MGDVLEVVLEVLGVVLEVLGGVFERFKVPKQAPLGR